ncbi:MAG: hypothetical protein H6823_04520 [Planctomycetaceae bacterium]|nr:hypothetical protein [Planctomycetaceae bacterium]
MRRLRISSGVWRVQGVLARLKGIDRAELTKTDGIQLRHFQRILNNDIAEAEFRDVLIPISNRWGFHISFPSCRSKFR